MKNIIMAVSLVAAAGAALAGAEMTNGTTVTGGSNGNCTLINDNVIPRLSNNVKAGYNCNTTTGYIGVGTASMAGNNHSYALGNKGGSMVEGACPGVATANTAIQCATSAADTGSNT